MIESLRRTLDDHPWFVIAIWMVVAFMAGVLVGSSGTH